MSVAVDGDSGIGVGTPIQPGTGTGLSIAQPLKYTLLSLPYYAQIMGIAPPHFQGATAGTVFPINRNACNDVWPRWSWQDSDHVSHEDLARVIYDAEQDLARILGFYPGPYWIEQEIHTFPRHHRRDVWRYGGLNLRGAPVSLQTNYTKFIASGQRNAATLLGTATTIGGSLKYTDEDGDGFAETATITIATSLTDVCEIKVYHTGTSGAPEWEIRPARSKSIVGTNVVLVFDSWLFIDPDLQGAYPTSADRTAINISTVANYVTSVEVRREFTDFTQNSAVFFWNPLPTALPSCSACSGTGCAACSLTEQNGCIQVRDVENGIVVPMTATYSADNGQWAQDAFTVCRDPDLVKLYYYAGELNDLFLSGRTCETLSNFWAHTIAWIATARLERPFCSCGNVRALADRLRTDLALSSGDVSFAFDFTELANPLGTRMGEIMAWRRIEQIATRQIKGGII